MPAERSRRRAVKTAFGGTVVANNKILATESGHRKSQDRLGIPPSREPICFNGSLEFHFQELTMKERLFLPRRAAWPFVAALAWSVVTVQAQPVETNEAQVKANHCVMEIEPVATGENVSATKEIGCFPTFAAAVAAATKGSVTLPADTAPGSVSEADVQSAAATLIGIDYDSRFYRGASISWYAPNFYGCYGGYSYVANMPAWFNNRLTSTRGFNGCTRNTSYDRYWRTGDWVRCFPNCYYVGSFMDNRASSKRWTR
jgi:hypothetical protein